jgi:hypothetical protein
MLKVYLCSSAIYYGPVAYIWEVFATNKQLVYEWVSEPSVADIVIGGEHADLSISNEFYENLPTQKPIGYQVFSNECLIRDAAGREDLLSTCFYMINCIQEYGNTDCDEVGRFKYSNSYQFKFGNLQDNLVQTFFDRLASHPKLASSVSRQNTNSRIFLSHDIDSVEGALLQDGLHLLKKGRWLSVLPLILNVLIQKPDWLNMDLIMKIEDEYSFKSAFFWIVNQGRVNQRLVNADYDIRSRKIQSKLQHLQNSGWENGLHKSVSENTFKEEIDKLGFVPEGNRFHYLKFNLPLAFDEIEASGIRMDGSVGFAEAYGFRNSYGLPFRPYNFKTSLPYNFVEVPLNIMDGTFQRYMKVPVSQTFPLIIDFIEKNKYNCLLSVLWHNTFFTHYKYKGYLDVYKQLLSYFYENKFGCVNPVQITKEFLEKQQ